MYLFGWCEGLISILCEYRFDVVGLLCDSFIVVSVLCVCILLYISVRVGMLWLFYSCVFM